MYLIHLWCNYHWQRALYNIIEVDRKRLNRVGKIYFYINVPVRYQSPSKVP